MTLEAQLEALAADLGRLRRATVETPFDWQIDRLCDQLWWLLAPLKPSAAQLYRDGLSIEEALAVTDRETLRLRRLLGDPERDLRLSGLI